MRVTITWRDNSGNSTYEVDAVASIKQLNDYSYPVGANHLLVYNPDDVALIDIEFSTSNRADQATIHTDDREPLDDLVKAVSSQIVAAWNRAQGRPLDNLKTHA